MTTAPSEQKIMLKLYASRKHYEDKHKQNEKTREKWLEKANSE